MLGGLKKLEYLVACYNKIKDVSVVLQLPKLSYLEVQGNPIQDDSPLDKLKNCTIKQ